MKSTVEKRSAIADANERLTALQIRGEELQRTIADCDHHEAELRSAVQKAERACRVDSCGGLYELPPTVARRLQDAQEALAGLLDRRDKAKEELGTLQAKKIGVIREVAADVWAEYVDTRGSAIEAGLDLVDRAAPLVERYTIAAERLEDAKAGLDRLFSPLGPHAERVLSELRRQLPDVEPDNPADLEALHKASRMRQLFWRNPLA